jgi:hypothetical protein
MTWRRRSRKRATWGDPHGDRGSARDVRKSEDALEVRSVMISLWIRFCDPQEGLRRGRLRRMGLALGAAPLFHDTSSADIGSRDLSHRGTLRS